ncbi:hypothetical protein C8R43DRAFT_1239692 [Mycena crocata]|nr:hypothetical protein C8R43DRAFT_1239692 [Mycena crocata]
MSRLEKAAEATGRLRVCESVKADMYIPFRKPDRPDAESPQLPSPRSSFGLMAVGAHRSLLREAYAFLCRKTLTQSQRTLSIPSFSSPMLFTTLFSVFAAVATVQAAAIDILPRQDKPTMPVFTATRVYQTLTNVPPYIVTATTTMTWTMSPSTTIAHPTGPGV